MKITPPWSRRRCTQPHRVTVWPSSGFGHEAAVVVRMHCIGGFADSACGVQAPLQLAASVAGATTPIEMMYFSASSTLMSSSMQSLRAQHQEEAGGRVRRGRHVDADVVAAPGGRATSPPGVPVTKAMVHTPARGYCTSTALRNALPLDENSVSETCLTLE